MTSNNNNLTWFRVQIDRDRAERVAEALGLGGGEGPGIRDGRPNVSEAVRRFLALEGRQLELVAAVMGADEKELERLALMLGADPCYERDGFRFSRHPDGRWLAEVVDDVPVKGYYAFGDTPGEAAAYLKEGLTR